MSNPRRSRMPAGCLHERNRAAEINAAPPEIRDERGQEFCRDAADSSEITVPVAGPAADELATRFGS